MDADKGAVFTLVDAACPVIPAVCFDGASKPIMRYPAGCQGRVVGHDLERADISAERVDVGDAGHCAQGRADGPIEQRPAFCKGQSWALDREHEHLAERTGDRCQAPAHAVRQVTGDIRESLRNLVARPVNIGAVFEIECDVGKRVFGRRAQNLLVRDAKEFEFDWHRYALLDLLRRQARRLHDDFDLNRRDVREGVDRQTRENDHANADKEKHAQQHEKTLGKRKLGQAFEIHPPAPSPSKMPRSADTLLAATSSLSVRPPETTT